MIFVAITGVGFCLRQAIYIHLNAIFLQRRWTGVCRPDVTKGSSAFMLLVFCVCCCVCDCVLCVCLCVVCVCVSVCVVCGFNLDRQNCNNLSRGTCCLSLMVCCLFLFVCICMCLFVYMTENVQMYICMYSIYVRECVYMVAYININIWCKCMISIVI